MLLLLLEAHTIANLSLLGMLLVLLDATAAVYQDSSSTCFSVLSYSTCCTSQQRKSNQLSRRSLFWVGGRICSALHP
jgi:hypothetical protein